MTKPTRVFLCLQGPHGPFFDRLSAQLRDTGAEVWRVGFNGGDAAFWRDKTRFIPYTDAPEAWPETCDWLLYEKGITDLVLYGDTRPIHAQAIKLARARGLRIHVFEEGYLRPYWITYERGGTNGNSPLMQMRPEQMRLPIGDIETHTPPAHWGDMREHVFYGALYHGLVMLGARRFTQFSPHRALPLRREFRLHLKRLLLMPALAVQRRLATRRIEQGGFPYHVALLQLEHDSALQDHSPFTSQADFLDLVMAGFAEGAHPHHHLVIKAHPLEDDRAAPRETITRLAEEHGLTGRVHFVRGGKLAHLLDHARSAVTVNSTAAQQVLWRGLPLKVFGAAIYDQPGFTAPEPLPAFFVNPSRPDAAAYAAFRNFLLASSQVPGGFYSARGRRQALRHLVDMMLRDVGPYGALSQTDAAQQQQFTPVP